jgi:cyanophycinase
MPVFLGSGLVAAVLLAQVSAGPPKGSLVVVGGGKIGPAIVERFVSLAGGPDANLVLIPTAAEDKELDLRKLEATFVKQFGVKHVTVLHTRDRKQADSEAFVAPLRQARGVWFGGGRQWRLVDSYLNTLTQRELEAVLERGGVVGGTSAGATIQGSYLVRGAREGNQIMMAKGYEEGFGYLKSVAVDQHLIRRRRENDLVGVIAAHPDLLGIGIDESTAIIVAGDRFEVIGDSQVGIYDGQDHDGKRYYFLSPGARFDLKTRAPISPQ